MDSPLNAKKFHALLLAWAIERDTRAPRYILQLDAAHRGNQSNCDCPSCGLPLTAVNAARTEFEVRPHFRHPPGAERERCQIVAARLAVQAVLSNANQLTLPRRRRSKSVAGLSGQYFEAWVELPAEPVRIIHYSFRDQTTAFLTLEDGRTLLVTLTGTGELAEEDGESRIHAKISLDCDHPDFAMMSPEEILSKLELSWSEACWHRHWADENLDRQAELKAIEAADGALDWLAENDIPSDMLPATRRETLLHREAKAILEREKRIRLPELLASAAVPVRGHQKSKSWSAPATELHLHTVELEVRLDHAVPDIQASWLDEAGNQQSMLIEITVTNHIDRERIGRLSSFGLPVLEINIGRMGGIVSREEYARLVIDELAGKRWLFHPQITLEEARLRMGLQQEADQAALVDQKWETIMIFPVEEWAKRYLKALEHSWEEEKMSYKTGQPTEGMRLAQGNLQAAREALMTYSIPRADQLGEQPLFRIVSRILSVQADKGVFYNYKTAGEVINAICGDREEYSKKWHSLYLIAISVYRPTLTSKQQDALKQWRHAVIQGIRNGDELYIRDTYFDHLLGFLFPEMREGLSHAFGTPLYIAR